MCEVNEKEQVNKEIAIKPNLLPAHYVSQNFVHPRLLFADQENCIFIAAMPKSGSSFLCAILEELTGYEYHWFVYAGGRSQQELYFPAMVNAIGKNVITKTHSLGIAPTVNLLKLFGIKPIITIRNIPDVVVSMRDHFYCEDHWTSTAYIPFSVYKMNDEHIYDMIIDLCVPWLISFYVSWQEAKVKSHQVFYNDFIGNEKNTVKTIMGFLGISKTSEEIEQAIDQAMKHETSVLRRNKVVAGRGAELLSDKQMKHIRRYSDYYPETDLSPILGGNKCAK